VTLTLVILIDVLLDATLIAALTLVMTRGAKVSHGHVQRWRR